MTFTLSSYTNLISSGRCGSIGVIRIKERFVQNAEFGGTMAVIINVHSYHCVDLLIRGRRPDFGI